MVMGTICSRMASGCAASPRRPRNLTGTLALMVYPTFSFGTANLSSTEPFETDRYFRSRPVAGPLHLSNAGETIS